VEKVKEFLKNPAILKVAVIGVSMVVGFALTAISGFMGAAPDAVKAELCKDFKPAAAVVDQPAAPAPESK
jgi:hypothetical protein